MSPRIQTVSAGKNALRQQARELKGAKLEVYFCSRWHGANREEAGTLISGDAGFLSPHVGEAGIL